MIISASRRTDIPAFYARWFMNRIQAGYCEVPSPFNRNQVTHVSLDPADVDVIVFWTRNPRPLFPYLDELDQRGYRYYFLFTLLNNPRYLDPHSPRLKKGLRTFHELAGRIGPERVIWRYDPIVFGRTVKGAPWRDDPIISHLITDVAFHKATYSHMAQKLKSHTHRCVISFLNLYAKARRRMERVADGRLEFVPPEDLPVEQFASLMGHLVETARVNGMEILSCAEDRDLENFDIRPGKCIDDTYINNQFGLDVTGKKDPGQRKACGCVSSRDIGMYDSCLFECSYCYATRSFTLAKINRRRHHRLDSPRLIG